MKEHGKNVSYVCCLHVFVCRGCGAGTVPLLLPRARLVVRDQAVIPGIAT